MAVLSRNRSISFIYNQISVRNRKFTNISYNSPGLIRTTQRVHYLILERKSHILKNVSWKRYLNQISTVQIRYQSQQTIKNNDDEFKKAPYLKRSILYSLSVVVGGLFGVLIGYSLMTDDSQLENDNESVRTKNVYESTKIKENRDSKYNDFPISIHLYKYESCPYCSQITAYLDYFGFNYKVTEVDSYSKEEITSFTKARQLPIVVIVDKETGNRWHLANATAILSAFESLRNSKHIEFSPILDQYLPILKGKVVKATINPFKYNVKNSDLNDIEIRRWINNYAIPTLKLNSISNFKDLFETVNHFSNKSEWNQRYSTIKYLYVFYKNAFKTKSLYSNLEKQLNSANKKPRDLLHEIIDKWEAYLNDNLFVSRTDKPNLADISFFGAVRSFEGCALFRESIGKHPKFKAWYDRMQNCILKGYPQESLNKKKNFFFYLKSSYQQDELPKDFSSEKTLKSEKKLNETILINKSTNTDNLVKKEKLASNEINLFRVLAVNYLAHLVIFTYAGWMGR